MALNDDTYTPLRAYLSAVDEAQQPTLSPAWTTPIDPAIRDAPMPVLRGDNSRAWERMKLSTAQGLQNLAGGVGAALGADEFAANRFATAKKDQAMLQSPELAARVGTWGDVHGLGDAIDFARAKFIESSPQIAGGAVAGALTGGGALPAFAVGTALNAPLEIGDVLGRQQDDPQARDLSPLQKLGRAAAAGTGSAALQSIVPGRFGRSVLGRTVGKTAGEALESAAQTPVRQGVRRYMQDIALAGAREGGLNALTGGAGEALKQQGVTPGGPLDWDAIQEAAITGGVLGGPMGAVGHVAERAHAVPGRALDTAKDAYGDASGWVKQKAGAMRDAFNDPEAVEAAGEKVGRAASDAAQAGRVRMGAFTRGVAKGAQGAAETGAAFARGMGDGWAQGDAGAWGEHISAGLKDAAEGLTGTIAERTRAARERIQALLDDPAVPDAVKAQARAAGENVGDKTRQAWLKAAADAREALTRQPPEADTTLGDLNAALTPDDTAQRIREGSPLGDLTEWGQKTGQDLVDWAEKHAASAAQWARATGQALLAHLEPETRAKVEAAMNRAGDKASQAYIASVKLAQDAKDRAVRLAGRVTDSLGDGWKGAEGEDTPDGTTRRSEDYSGARAAIAEKLAPHVPEAMLDDPQALNVLGEAVRRFIAAAQARDAGELQTAGRHLRAIFGDATEDILADVQPLAGQITPQGNERFYGALNVMRETARRDRNLSEVIARNLPEDSSADPRALADVLLRWARGEAGASLKGQQRAFFHGRVREKIAETFGPNAENVMTALEQYATEGSRAHTLDGGGPRLTEAALQDHEDLHGDLPHNTEGGFVDRDNNLQGRDAQRQFFGGGGERAAASGQKTLPDPAAYEAMWGKADSATHKRIEQLKAQYPAADVRFVTEAERHQLEGRPEKGGDTQRGYVMVEQPTADELALTAQELHAARLDTSGYANSDSRLDVVKADKATGVKPVIVDAYKLTRAALAKLPSDGSPDRVRNARAFMLGVTQLMTEHGPFRVPDSTRISAGLTWGQAKAALREFHRPDRPERQRAEHTERSPNTLAAIQAMRDAAQVLQASDKAPARNIGEKLGEIATRHANLDGLSLYQLGQTLKNPNRKVSDIAPQVNALHAKLKTLDARATDVDRALHDAARQDAVQDISARARLLDLERQRGLVELQVLDATGASRTALLKQWHDLTARYDQAWAEDAAKQHQSDTGREAMGKDAQIHLAEASLSADDLIQRANEDGSAHDVPRRRLDQGERDALKSAALAAGKMLAVDDAHANEVGRKLAALTSGYAYALSADDRARLDAVVRPLHDPEGMLGGKTQAQRTVRNVAPVVGALYDKYQAIAGAPPDPKVVAAKKAAMIEKARSGDATLSRQLAASTDAPGLQRAAVHLGEHAPDTRALDIINERLDKLAQDPDVAYNLQTPGKARVSDADRADIQAHIFKVLGDKISVVWADLAHAGEYSRDALGDVIRLSVHALNPASVAYHESLHAFFARLRQAGAHDITGVLEKAAAEPAVRRQMQALFKDEPGVLDQLHHSPEERAAYMYQLWAAGHLKVGATQSLFTRIGNFIRSVLGIWSNDQRALHIMEYFNSGEYARSMGDINAVHRALMEPGRNKALEKVKSWTQPFTNLGAAVLTTGSQRVRDTGNRHLQAIADRIHPTLTDASNDVGWLDASRAERATRMNQLAEAIGHLTKAQMDETLASLQSGNKAQSLQARVAVKMVQRLLRDMHGYLTGAGVRLGDLGPDYFPRVWDRDAIAADRPAFRAMLAKYQSTGQFDGNVDKLVNRLSSNGGNDFDVEPRALHHDPLDMKHLKERKLDFISGEDALPFLNTDLMQTLGSYITQATRRAEWARRFGMKGDKLIALLEDAKAEGASEAQIAMTRKYLRGVTGTLGEDLSPGARKLIGNLMVYQNIRLLPLAVFSSIVDPLGIWVRGGTAGDALRAFVRVVRDIPKNFKTPDPHARDYGMHLSETLGVIDNAVLAHSLGALYTQDMTSGIGRKINDTFFRYNLMEQLNTSVRIAATEAAVKFIERHASAPGEHSGRWLAELGLQAGDVRLTNGRVALTEADGLTAVHALKMRAAVNRWVDGAVLRPNAADKTIWMNDPHFALIGHLKQFVYSFQHTILDRVVHEVREGNYTPAFALLSYVPVMIAADAAKGMIQGGGSQPDWKQDWTAADYVSNGIQRAGLYGTGQFTTDFVDNIRHGGAGFGALEGPTLDQLTDAIKTAGGRGRWGDFALNAMPAHALYGWTLDGPGNPDPQAVH